MENDSNHISKRQINDALHSMFDECKVGQEINQEMDFKTISFILSIETLSCSIESL